MPDAIAQPPRTQIKLRGSLRTVIFAISRFSASRDKRKATTAPPPAMTERMMQFITSLTVDDVRKFAAKTEPAAVTADTISDTADFLRETIIRMATTESRADVTVTPSV